jgi:hypothetical protein
MRDSKFRTTTLISAWFIVLAVTAWGILQITFFLATCVHEAGQAVACIAQGYRLITYCSWCRPFPITDCTNNHSALVAAGGSLLSITVWVTITIIFALWLRRQDRRDFVPLFVGSFGWLAWSFFCVSEVFSWAWLAHSTRIPMPDTVNFSTTTGIAPQSIIIAAVVLSALMMVFILPVGWKMIRMFSALRAPYQQ